ncbi:MAG TPA: hypothetical protein VFL91_20270 [Thermomicrobiales bacterium]|nr:hypothetical protein [Thermomicrobiales bacterium]
MGVLTGCRYCNRGDVPPAVTAELRPGGAAPVSLARLCGECAADPATLARFVRDFRLAFRDSLAPLRFAVAPGRVDLAPALAAVRRRWRR